MNLYDWVDRHDFLHAEARGLITVRSHNTHPIFIANYTDRASGISPGAWSDTLKKCRGLIFDDENNILAFPMQKYFNYDGSDETTAFVFDKIDGELGIVFHWRGQLLVTTKGDFHSRGANWANEWLQNHPDYVEYFNTIPPDYTAHVEIVHKRNQGLVKYDYEDLVLLGFASSYGWFPQLQQFNYPGRVPATFKVQSVDDLQHRPNSEGYVLYYDSNRMAKLKFGKALDHTTQLRKSVFNKYKVSAKDTLNWIYEQEDDDERETLSEIYDSIDSLYAYCNSTIAIYYDLLRERKRGDIASQLSKAPGWIRAGVFAILDYDQAALHSICIKYMKELI